MSQLARRAVPYTPVERALKETTVGLVSSAGVHRRSDAPYNLEGDERFHVFPGDIAAGDLMVTHGHYDHSDADRDINCVFPIDRLRELAAEGFLGGVSNKHIGFMGFTRKLGEMYERVAPAIAQEIERSQADAVLLTAGWPLCHRVVVAVQREIEMRGVPTVLITVSPEDSRVMRPPRAVWPAGFTLGHSLGPPGRPEAQRAVLKAALQQLEELHMPGTIVEKGFDAPGFPPSRGWGQESQRSSMDLASAVAKYLEAAGEFGRRAHLSALGLSKEETVRVVSAWDEDYQISRYLQLTREPDAALAAYPAEGRVFRINGFECSHFAFDARIREVLG